MAQGTVLSWLHRGRKLFEQQLWEYANEHGLFGGAEGGRTVISCSEAVRRLWEYLENDLDEEDREHVADHLTLCRRCCGEVEFTEALSDLLRSSTGPDIPTPVEQHLVGFLDSLEMGRRDLEKEAQ